MRPLRLAACLLAFVAASVRADEPLDPLRLVPRDANAVLVASQPRLIADALTSFAPLQQFGQFAAVKEQLSSTNNRRLLQLLRYYEREWGASWPDLLDKLAGDGAAFAVKYGDNAPALLVLQGRDEALMMQALDTVLSVTESELARQESPDKLRRATYRQRETIHIGDKLHVARVGAALLVANQEAALHAALDLSINGSQMSLARRPELLAAWKEMPSDALVKLWADLEPVHKNPQAAKSFRYPREDATQLFLIGGLSDVVGKAPAVVGAVTREDDGFALRVRMGAGRDATPNGWALHLPPVGRPGSLPLLEPPNVLLSSSFYLDLHTYWTQRTKLLTPEGVRELEDAEKKAGRFLAGRKMSELLLGSGAYHRVVVAQQTETGYTAKPGQPQPAFAFITSMRDPDFGQALNAILRTTALVLGSQAKLKLSEEAIDGIRLVGYRFPDGGRLANDAEGNRYNFSPCFAIVGDQFLAASTQQLGRNLIRELQKPMASQPNVAASRTQVYAAGGVIALKQGEETAALQAVLDQAVSMDDARAEIRRFADWLGTLGVLENRLEYHADRFLGEVRWRVGR